MRPHQETFRNSRRTAAFPGRLRVGQRQPKAPRSDGGSVDLWIARFSHLAQAGLFLATVAGFYFTVIPLYSKAVLEEAIAKREVELKSSEAALALAVEKAYRLERGNVMRAFTIGAMDRCTGVREAIRQPDPNAPTNIARVLDLDIDPRSCLAEEFAKANAAQALRQPDVEHVGQILTALGSELERKREEAKDRIRALPVLGAADQTILDPPGEYTRRVYQFAERAAAATGRPYPGASAAKQLADAVRRTQLSTAMNYRTGGALIIRERLSQIEWPTATTQQRNATK